MKPRNTAKLFKCMAAVLALVMLVSLLPLSVFAEGEIHCGNGTLLRHYDNLSTFSENSTDLNYGNRLTHNSDIRSSAINTAYPKNTYKEGVTWDPAGKDPDAIYSMNVNISTGGKTKGSKATFGAVGVATNLPTNKIHANGEKGSQYTIAFSLKKGQEVREIDPETKEEKGLTSWLYFGLAAQGNNGDNTFGAHMAINPAGTVIALHNRYFISNVAKTTGEDPEYVFTRLDNGASIWDMADPDGYVRFVLTVNFSDDVSTEFKNNGSTDTSKTPHATSEKDAKSVEKDKDGKEIPKSISKSAVMTLYCKGEQLASYDIAYQGVKGARYVENTSGGFFNNLNLVAGFHDSTTGNATGTGSEFGVGGANGGWTTYTNRNGTPDTSKPMLYCKDINVYEGLVESLTTKYKSEGSTVIGYQIKNGEDNLKTVRFIGGVDSLDGKGIGFNVEAVYQENGKTVKRTFRTTGATVYSSILETLPDGTSRSVTAKELGAEKLFALAIEGLPAGVDITFRVQCFKTFDDNKNVPGEIRTVTVTQASQNA